ncbi:MAG: extracellular solute-binding protein [Janthinobacterium lividum]
MFKKLTAAARAFVRVPSRVTARVPICVLLAVLSLSGACGVAQAAPAIAQYGEPRYAPGFTHFDYVNPDAPKGGTLTLANPNRITRFDTFNPYILRGNPAPGINLLFDTLTVGSDDEAASAYGLLADDIAVAADGLSVRFHVNAAARFSNGDPVTAADVKYAFDTLTSQAAAPTYRAVWQDVARATVIDRLSVRFDFRHPGRELPLLIGALPVFSPKWGQRADGSRPSFDAIALAMPIGSGPYTIASHSGGTQIVLQRNPHYWAANLPTRRGMFNFDRIVYKLYGDSTARLEAFKAGEFDASEGWLSRDWVRGYTGGRFNDGRLIKRVFAHSNNAGLQGFFMNTRRPLFQDVRVRQALDLAFDFPYLNRQIFYNQYRRSDSFFTNSELAAHGLPSPGERALLEPLRAELDPAVFGAMVVQPDTAPPGSLRANLLQARALLAEAGWTYRDGALRNHAGQPFVFEILDDSGSASSYGPVVAPYARNLAKLGITANFRVVDFALYDQRLQNLDFDMTTLALAGSQSPGNELRDEVGSAAAGVHGSGNLSGIHSPAVDALVQAVLAARTRLALVDASRALDRVLMHGYYVVPQWYLPVHRVAYRRGLAYPATLPLYYDAQSWMLSTWWDAAAAAGTLPTTAR